MMKKSRVLESRLFSALLCGILVLFAGCGDLYRDKYVHNNSDYEVTFTFRGYDGGPHSLAPHAQDRYDARTIYLAEYSANPPRVSARYSAGDEVEFYNTPPLSLHITNELNRMVDVRADGCLDAEPLQISASGSRDVVIYTARPHFTAYTNDPGYTDDNGNMINIPVGVSFNVSIGSDGNPVMHAIIHW